jgi:hypothetical protein
MMQVSWSPSMIFLGLEEYFAGDVAIVEGRELITSVTLKTLIHDMNSTDQGYCFVRVLAPEDRFPFVKVLPPSLIVDIYRRRSIKLGTWVRVMKCNQFITELYRLSARLLGRKYRKTNTVSAINGSRDSYVVF